MVLMGYGIHNYIMKQQGIEVSLTKSRTRKAILFDEMNLVVPCSKLLALLTPHAPQAKTGRLSFLRILFV
jgi:hypothetical protein